MGRKKKNSVATTQEQPAKAATTQNILCEVFANAAEAVIDGTEKRVAVLAELTKHEIGYGCWDVPVQEDGRTVRFERRIIVKDTAKLEQVINDLQHGRNEAKADNA